ncbi:MAG TPA: cell wall hydrolase [Pseudolabrys sp.]|nr:cell wall hydrolase [Pseudolabrys sp.]
MTLVPTTVAYSDLGALLAHQPGVAQRWREHLIASPFGTIHVAMFSMPRPLGTRIPHPPLYALANFDPLDLTAAIGSQQLGDGSSALQFPAVNRRDKRDALMPRQRAPLPPLPPALAIAPLPNAQADAALHKDDDRFDADLQSDLPPPTPDASTTFDIDLHRDLAPRHVARGEADKSAGQGSARVFFGAAPFAPSEELAPWAPGHAPVVAHGSDEGESVAAKGVVTGEDARPKSPAERLKLAGGARARAEKCLANAVYFESRDEPVRAQIAVAQVVLNRVFSPFYPKNVCGVVYQNARRRLACQFTFACDGKPDLVTEPDAWERAKRIARDTLDGKLWMPEVAKSTHYHDYWAHPDWVHEMRRMDRLGGLIFYRPRNWGDGADEPRWGDPKTTAREAAILQKM